MSSFSTPPSVQLSTLYRTSIIVQISTNAPTRFPLGSASAAVLRTPTLPPAVTAQQQTLASRPPEHPPRYSRDSSHVIGGIVGGILAVAVVGAVFVGVWAWRRRRQRRLKRLENMRQKMYSFGARDLESVAPAFVMPGQASRRESERRPFSYQAHPLPQHNAADLIPKVAQFRVVGTGNFAQSVARNLWRMAEGRRGRIQK
ncbi:uncharacterized protein VTP21DRAFT_10103 [Calcarisporiella thermophila]|uniref:uncharacterized protein n=1 Tax=Calcarisporiella thermophila TaxID=911321 RepID=UPI003743B3C6